MAGSSASSVSGGGVCKVSRKPWFLTYEQETLLVWRNQGRLKVLGDESAGRVIDVSVEDQEQGLLLFRGEAKSQNYKFRCSLENYCADSNTFCQSLRSSAEDATLFCSKLSHLTNGNVVFEKPVNEEPPLKKRKVTERKGKGKKIQETKSQQEDLNKELTLNCIGTYQIPIELLQEPKPSLQIREVKDWCVDYLVEMLENSEEDHENLTSPLLVVCSVTKEEFEVSKLDKYFYQVIGGVQRFAAISKINKEKCRLIISRKCCIYGAGLSREALLTLARQHNDVSEKYKSYKKECLSCFLSSQVSKVYVETAIQMAMLSPQTYHKMQEVFRMFENGELKGQKPKALSSAISRKKALQGQNSAKAHHFKAFQGLEDEVRLDILTSIASKDISFREALERIAEAKSWKATQEVFMKEVQVQSWDEAEEQYPSHTQKERLLEFQVKPQQAIPESFKTYCSEVMGLSRTNCSHIPVKVAVIEKSRIEFFAVSPCLEFSVIEKGNWQLVALDLAEITEAGNIKRIIEAVKLKNDSYFTLALYHYDDSIQSSLVDICKERGLRAQQFTICNMAVSSSQHGEDTKLLKGEHIILGWFPGTASDAQLALDHPLCQNADVIICSEWLKYVMVKCRSTAVLDIFSQTGQTAQMAIKCEIDCTCIQSSSKGVQKLLKTLQPGYVETQELVDDLDKALSEANKVVGDGDDPNDPSDPTPTSNDPTPTPNDPTPTSSDPSPVPNDPTPKGFLGGRYPLRKRDIDECADGTDGCDETCRNTVGSYQCGCTDPQKFYLTDDGHTCEALIDECTVGSDDCEQICVDTLESFTCHCNAGFKLNDDGKTCEGLSKDFAQNTT